MNRKVMVAKSEMNQVTKGNTRGRVKENTKVDVHMKGSYQSDKKRTSFFLWRILLISYTDIIFRVLFPVINRILYMSLQRGVKV